MKDVDTIVDLFGGSGLLSRVAKDMLPACTVVYNDYDYYVNRRANIDQTNALLREISPYLDKIPEDKKLPAEVKRKVLSLFLKYEQRGEVDYITLSASLLFSGNWAKSYEDMTKQTMYNRMVKGNYDASGYLDGLEVTHTDYRNLFDSYKDRKNVLFVIDPPYLQTDVCSYKSDVYWQLKDYLDVITLIRDTKYILFTSNKSQIIELCDWLNKHYDAKLFQGALIDEKRNRVNDFAAYKDIMISHL